MKPDQDKTSAHYFPEDKINLFFSAVIVFLQIYFGLYMAVIAPVIAVTLLLTLIHYQSRSQSKLLKFLRSYIHIPVYGIIFISFQTFVHRLNPNDYDWLLSNADHVVFRFDITVWLERLTNRFLTEILTFSYISYYILPTLTFILLFIQKNTDNSYPNARKYLLSILVGWHGAFIFYLVLPAAGPGIAFPQHYNIPIIGLTQLTNSYLNSIGGYLKGSGVRNTYPSMHFAIILITNYFAFKLRRNYFYYCTLPMGILLGFATLYLRQHYFIDLVGSVIIAVYSIYIASGFIKSPDFQNQISIARVVKMFRSRGIANNISIHQ